MRAVSEGVVHDVSQWDCGMHAQNEWASTEGKSDRSSCLRTATVQVEQHCILSTCASCQYLHVTLEVVLYLDCIRHQLGTVILALTKVWQSGVRRNLDSPSQYAKTLNMADSWYSQEWDENGWGKHHGVNPGLSLHLPHTLCWNWGNILHFKPHRNSTAAESGVMSTCMSVTSRLQGAHTRDEKGVQVANNLHSLRKELN